MFKKLSHWLNKHSTYQVCCVKQSFWHSVLQLCDSSDASIFCSIPYMIFKKFGLAVLAIFSCIYLTDSNWHLVKLTFHFGDRKKGCWRGIRGKWWLWDPRSFVFHEKPMSENTVCMGVLSWWRNQLCYVKSSGHFFHAALCRWCKKVR